MFFAIRYPMLLKSADVVAIRDDISLPTDVVANHDNILTPRNHCRTPRRWFFMVFRLPVVPVHGNGESSAGPADSSLIAGAYRSSIISKSDSFTLQRYEIILRKQKENCTNLPSPKQVF